MRLIFPIICLVLAVFMAPVILAAQTDNLLPEKAPGISSEEKASGSVSLGKQAEKPAWGMMVIVLMLGGFLFLFLEIAIIPGFGITGIIGILLLGGGIVAAYMKLSSGMAVFATFAGVVATGILLVGYVFNWVL